MSKYFAAFALALVVLGCKTTNQGKPSVDDKSATAISLSPNLLGVPEVKELVQHRAATLVDANGPDIRQSMGVVPGSLLLSNSHDYALSELPPSKATKLVFYCGGEKCRASDSAAARALQAGYTDVNVMRAGIRGWKDAGQATESPRS